AGAVEGLNFRDERLALKVCGGGLDGVEESLVGNAQRGRVEDDQCGAVRGEVELACQDRRGGVELRSRNTEAADLEDVFDLPGGDACDDDQHEPGSEKPPPETAGATSQPCVQRRQSCALVLALRHELPRGRT